MKKYAIIEITGGNPRYKGLFTVAELSSDSTFAFIHNLVIDTLMTPGNFIISKEISMIEYLKGVKRGFSSRADRVLDSEKKDNKKYIVVYTIDRQHKGGINPDRKQYKDGWALFSQNNDNLREAKKYYDKLRKKKSLYTASITEIIESTDY